MTLNAGNVAQLIEAINNLSTSNRAELEDILNGAAHLSNSDGRELLDTVAAFYQLEVV